MIISTGSVLGDGNNTKLYFGDSANMVDSKGYLDQTEKAVTQLFNAKEFYSKKLKNTIPPIFVSDEMDESKWLEDFNEWQQENKEITEISLNNQREYLGLTISNATICGSILQIAFMGIKTFSNNSVVPALFSTFIPANKKDNRQIFCVGKEVFGMPAGMLIYASRNQYNHMDEGLKNKLAIFVFDTLAKYYTGGKYKDPAFDLDNTIINNYSHNILALLEWNNYATYRTDMETMI